MDKQKDRTVVVEFWDIASPHSMRTLPYLMEWHERYATKGLRVIGVHTSAMPQTEDEAVIEAAVERLGIKFPVVVDAKRDLWQLYGPRGYPTRYVWERGLKLVDLHEGEGAYQETEELLQEMLGVSGDLVDPFLPEEAPGAQLAMPSYPMIGAFSGGYAAGGVWVSYAGDGVIVVNGEEIAVTGTGAVELVSHPEHTEAEISIEPGAGVEVIETRFTPGILAG